MSAGRLQEHFQWAKAYDRAGFTQDLIAALIITIILVPQSLAYALLAGLPPQAGLFAAIVPPIAYAFFGSSRFLHVGPVAMTSIMTAAIVSTMPEGTRLVSAAMMALMAGAMLVGLGILRGGALSTFFSRPVVSAYISGAAILIILSQLKHFFGVDISGSIASELLPSLFAALPQFNSATTIVGIVTLAGLWIGGKGVPLWLRMRHVRKRRARLIGRISPIFVIAIVTIGATLLKLSETSGVEILREVPASLPKLAWPNGGLEQWRALALSSAIIALVAFVDSVSVGQTFAGQARGRVDPNRELLGVGAANIAGGLSGAYPVAGSLSRSAVSFASGARTPLSGAMTGVIMAAAVLTVMPLLYFLPLAALAALIIYSCFSLINFKGMWRTWIYSRADGLTALGAFFAVLVFGVQYGVLVGTALSMLFHIRLTLTPHTVEVGRFAGTQHYRDVDRFEVETFDEVKTIRIDESLYFANARFLEDTVASLVAKSPKLENLILMCPAVNRIDASALKSLFAINKRLRAAGISLHLSEMHAYVMDRLHRSDFLQELSGEIFMSQHDAIERLRPEPDWSQYSDHIDIHG